MVKIRQVQFIDCAHIVELMKQLGHPATQEELESRFKNLKVSTDDYLVVAESVSQKIVGFLHAKVCHTLHYYPSVEISALVADQSHRKFGIGKTLMVHAENWAREKGFSIFWLRSNIRRDEAHKFYSSLEYDVIGTSHFFQKTLLNPKSTIS